MDTPTETQLTAAGFPDTLRPYLLNGTLVFSHARPDGTLEFMVPNEDEPKSAFTLVWHPEAPGTWAYDGLRFHVKEEKYSDIHHHDPLGDELVDFGSREGLLDWLDELPGKVLPPVPAAVGDESGTQETRKPWSRTPEQVLNEIDAEFKVGWDTDATLNLLSDVILEHVPEHVFAAHLRAVAQRESFPGNLRPGDEVTWNDPDDGHCTRSGILSAIEFIGDDSARITFQDGWSAEVLLSELS